MDDNNPWQKLAAEFLGTAFLVFVGVGSVPAFAIVRGAAPFTGSELGFISLAFGAIVIVTVYVFGYISGNHINPAVTIGLAITGKFRWAHVPGYLIAQVLGATAGALAIAAVLGHAAVKAGLGVASFNPQVTSIPQALFAEFIGTFILVFAIFGVIYRKAVPGWAGLAIGFAVFAAIIPVAPATGAAINPARVFGPMLVEQLLGGTVQWDQIWVYLVGEILGGIAGAVLFGVVAHTAMDRATRTETVSGDVALEGAGR
jgi:glycerol uptake facilitator protein